LHNSDESFFITDHHVTCPCFIDEFIEKPSTGFELARRFDRSMGFFWNATHQQIYRELNGMLKKGWISTLEEEGANSRKKTYQVEQLGRIQLAAWIENKANLLNSVMT
jgi:DNA-binding PadR family transcriptional regulator